MTVVNTTNDPIKEDNDVSSEAETPMAKHMQIETAIMLENRNIFFAVNGRMPNGHLTSSSRDISPEDPDYEVVRKCFNLNEPGDAYLNRNSWAEMDWVLESEITEEQNAQSSNLQDNQVQTVQLNAVGIEESSLERLAN